jgi:hypothetical protein
MGSLWYPDMTKEEQQKWLNSQVKSPKSCSFYTPTHQAFLEIDTVYVYCDRDAIFPMELQKAMVDEVKATGAQFREGHLAAGHWPSLSMPEALTTKLLEYV